MNGKIKQLQPSTVAEFKNICKEKKPILEYMIRFRSGFEKAIATIILETGGKK